MTWPPPRPPQKPVEDRPWDPGHPQEPSLHEESDRLVYIVVDETIEDWVGLSVAPWPHADDEGRLRFPQRQDPIEVGTSREALEEFLRRAEEPEEEKARVRVGMVFGARVKERPTGKLLEELREHAQNGEVRIRDLGSILTRPVDLTDEGRRLAQLACYGAVLSTLPPELEQEWRLTKEIQK